MSHLSPSFAAMAELCADAVQSPVLIGVRPNGRGWFVHCNGIEYDGDPEDSIPALLSELSRRAQSQEHEARKAAGDAAAVQQLLGAGVSVQEHPQ